MTTAETALPDLLTPKEVATMFRVDPKTVTRWAQNGWLPFIRTAGGHRRYRREDVQDIMDGKVRVGA